MKKNIRNASAFASSILTAILASRYMAEKGWQGTFLTVLSGIFTNIGSEYIHPLANDILAHFNNKSPELLNHDIQTAIIDSMEDAVNGIVILYKKQTGRKRLLPQEKKIVHIVKKDLLEALRPNNGFFIEKTDLDDIIFLNTNNDAPNTFIESMNSLLREEMNQYNIHQIFKDLFIEKFFALTQFYFGEKLKSDKYSTARHALERTLAEETRLGLQRLLEIASRPNLSSRQRSTATVQLTRKQMAELADIVNNYTEAKELKIPILKAIDELSQISKDQNLLRIDLISIKAQLTTIRKNTIFNQRIRGAIILGCVISTTIIVVNHRHRMFSATFILKPEHKLNYYPSLVYPVKFKIMMPDLEMREKEIGVDNQLYLPKIQSNFKGKKVSVEIDDPYWELSSDSALLIEQETILLIRPNSSLAFVKGIVRNANRKGAPIANVPIKIDNCRPVFSDKEGVFEASIPEDKRRETYLLTIDMPGYEHKEQYHKSRSTNAEVHLTQTSYK